MSGPLRVGDTERDAAVAALGEHFAAGRLTKDEFDERSARAWAARFGGDLDELFTDLPQPVAVRGAGIEAGFAGDRSGRFPGPFGASAGVSRPRSLPRLLLLAPLAMMALGGLLFLIVVSAPWLLFVFGLLFLFGGPPWSRRHRHWHDGGHGRSGRGPGGWGSSGWGPGGSSGWAPSGRDDRFETRRDWPPARPGWGPQPRGGWATGR
ncbi:DUF1707 SHOCT-like domain-containing protein [Jiangella anatolica]|uniref:DUF1707 SHOCT-like domain-containing protein n=1 Tax=Jiangella anatolica TaxID=2670374 RepID=UPI0018F3393F|nr:DUF1707 domain-containing protein [Jiangella anatolica]